LALVGIIANPAASKDIRRLVAQGRVVPDWEKVNILRRVLLGLEAAGIQRVAAMPDSSHLVERARDDPQLSLDLEMIQMPTFYGEGDTVKASAMMGDLGVDCLVTLGGDGTNRAVARGCCSIPVVPISTGTNNVFPTMVEGTLAGLAAGLAAQGSLDMTQAVIVSKTAEVYVDGEFRDMALVDVALSRERYVATRAIWDLSTVDEVFLTRAEPSAIGLSSVGARLQPVGMAEDAGLQYKVAHRVEDSAQKPGRKSTQEDQSVLAPIAPGIVSWVPISQWGLMELGERIVVEPRHCTVALDGERSFSVNPGERLEVEIRRNGPPVVQVDAALRLAGELGLFRS
jgi:NAD kinase